MGARRNETFEAGGKRFGERAGDFPGSAAPSECRASSSGPWDDSGPQDVSEGAPFRTLVSGEPEVAMAAGFSLCDGGTFMAVGHEEEKGLFHFLFLSPLPASLPLSETRLGAHQREGIGQRQPESKKKFNILSRADHYLVWEDLRASCFN